ncbi:helix-turn-helix domain-containing protein [Tropicibacter naphthalenivorans]|uniref:Bacteriophage CI repressor helix-turn-helix domain protein n=1 Tax=Tropicibacter naphthalenivorans TaxID=441103 RepID=A0A0P1GFX7_9RHOB|nr:helix-turn-helix domain-containing protein [Tropicibacter naphthalenivorans]CUH80726.1 Bacteriophage CI repressor helix-turn-helix domain protein [Tropicibacter naphthalenivorans]SMC89658.1 Bacteriophage CI repressor helix-turn-helix domain-containing protein [Tropicibacter naphthalenivorans]
MEDANDVGEIIERMKRRFGVDSDSDLAFRLMVSRSAIANWRNRNSIPARYRKLDQGEGDLFLFGGEMTDIERAGMRLAIMRLVRDFSDIAKDFRGFLANYAKAAASVQPYYAEACQDVMNEMEARGSDDPDNCLQLLAYAEFEDQ